MSVSLLLRPWRETLQELMLTNSYPIAEHSPTDCFYGRPCIHLGYLREEECTGTLLHESLHHAIARLTWKGISRGHAREAQAVFLSRFCNYPSNEDGESPEEFAVSTISLALAVQSRELKGSENTGDTLPPKIRGCQPPPFTYLKDGSRVLGETRRPRCSFSAKNSGGATLG